MRILWRKSISGKKCIPGNCLFCLKTVFRYVPFNTLAAMVCLLVPATFAGLQVLLLQRIVDNALAYVRGGAGGAEAMEAMVMWGICLVALLTLGTSMQRIGTYQMDLASVKLMERMAPDIAGRLTELEYASFEQQDTQELFQKMSGSPETGIFNCCLSTMFVIQRTINLFFSMAVIFAISPWMGLGIIVIGIPMMVLGYYAAGHSMTMMEEGADARRRMADLKSLLTNKHAMFEMKLFDAAQLFGEKWNHYSTEYADIALRENREVMKLDICSRLLNVIYLIFVVFMAAAGLLGGSLTLGQFTAALNGVAGIGSGLNDGSRQVIWLFANAMGIHYYMDFLKLETRKDMGTVEKLSYYDIAFENVSFRYPGTERDILKNVTEFHIFTDCYRAFPGFFVLGFVLDSIGILTAVAAPVLLARILELAGEESGSGRALAGAILLYGLCLACAPVVEVFFRTLSKRANVQGERYFGGKLVAFSEKIQLAALEDQRWKAANLLLCL